MAPRGELRNALRCKTSTRGARHPDSPHQSPGPLAPNPARTDLVIARMEIALYNQRYESWWDMEPFSAAFVYETGRSFEQLRAACNLTERFGKVKFSGTEASPDQMEYIELLSTRTRMDLPQDWRESVLSILGSVEKYCDSIGLKLASQAAREFLTELQSGTITTYSDVSEAIGTLGRIIRLQLRENLFMFISPERAAFQIRPLCLNSITVHQNA